MNKNVKILLGFAMAALGLLLIFVTLNTLLIIVGAILTAVGGFLATWGFNERNQVKMPFYTTDTIPGKKIVKSLDAVQSQSNPLGGAGLAQSSAKKALEKEALKLGANAIVGYRTDRQQSKTQITYYMYGTAVIVEDEN